MTSGAPRLVGADDASLLGPGETFGADQLAGLAQFLVESQHEPDVRLDVLGRPRANAGGLPAGAGGVHHQHVFHDEVLSVVPGPVPAPD